MHPETDLAWAAGFFDGEGYFGVNDAHNRASPFVSVTQKRQMPLLKLQQMFQGSLHYYEYQYSFWVWRLTGAKSVLRVAPVVPYLVLKKAEAELLLEMATYICSLPRVGRVGHPNRVWKTRQDYTVRLKGLRDVV